ncbi:MAG: chromosomal replication initiator protein DnaA [Clostridia bacterium]|nr:chromosomal replication initiator protein DnaA [Clostridia bacterium]MDD4685836.1 chromosomal replication initiator protein DnaA [Clostridia bacterium]
MQELNSHWAKVLSKLELKVSTVSFELWIKTIEPIGYKDNKTLILVASSKTAKNQLIKNHSEQLKETIAQVFGDGIDFQILDENEKDEYLKNNPSLESTDINNKEDRPVFNNKYTFENFVVGKSNQFVYAAARAVSENPGKRFNPLFIYGGVGLGKTHLLHAIGNYISQFFPKLKIKYVTCEKFTNDYIESILSKREESKVEFRELYRNLDVLMVDDIQFLSKKDSTQEEFFHTFNDLYQNNKQIILSSDRPPKEIATLAKRLESRFACGLIQDIQTPDFETRIAILRKKAQQERYFIDDEVIEFIAEKIDTNIREMEGFLSKVHFFATLLGKKTVGIEEAREAFKEQLDNTRENITIDLIMDKVCDYFDISKADIVGKKRSKEIVEPRMIAIYLVSELMDVPLISIGKHFGGRDHTTIIHARDKITDQVKFKQTTKNIISELKSIITNQTN